MRPGLSKILVTGGAGFIGSAFVRLVAKTIRDCPRSSSSFRINRGLSLIVLDKLTYAGDLARLKEAEGKYKFYKTDICDKNKISQIFNKEKPDIVVHFAAESHVDRSITDSSSFIETNIKGTQVLLDCSRQHKISRFIHMSTDEVYGEIEKGKFYEDFPLKPNSPYAASKAAADLLIKSYIRTYDFPAILIRPCNNYGPWQYPEKLIPRAILTVIKNKKIPVYGAGKNVREWLYVEDCAKGIFQIMKIGKIGEIYNLGSNFEKQNIDVAKIILKNLKKDAGMLEFVKDRLGHDLRYSLNSQKVLKEVDWRAAVKFEEGIKLTVIWCLEHKNWLFSKWQDITRLYK